MTIRTLGISLALVTGTLGLAHVRGQEAGPINFVELFQMLDVNNDMVIERGEVPESGRAAFDRLAKLADTNKDGKIDREEYRDILVRARESMASALPGSAPQFQAMDKNGDGKLSRDEFTGPRPLFARIDADGDGLITREEAMTFRANAAAGGNAPGMNQFGPRFKAMDKNNDGKVSRDEFAGIPANFDRMDANKDGFLVPAEIRQFQLRNNPAAKKAAAPANKAAKDKE